MLTILIILIVSKVAILTVTGIILWRVLGHELRMKPPRTSMPGVKCVYCHFTPSILHGEEQRWEGDDLLLVKTYECRHCHMPFWKVERVRTLERHPS